MATKVSIRHLDQIRKDDSKLGQALDDLSSAVSTVAGASVVNPNGGNLKPSPVSGISVSGGAGILHVALTDHAPQQRGLHYFVETSIDPSFSQPHVFALGPSRTFRQALGSSTKLFVQAYSQYPAGGSASVPIVHGGQTAKAVDLSGTTEATWLPSTGSGTASSDGTQGGQGAGAEATRNGRDGKPPILSTT